jgi:hypothetical protein
MPTGRQENDKLKFKMNLVIFYFSLSFFTLIFSFSI